MVCNCGVCRNLDAYFVLGGAKNGKSSVRKKRGK